MLTGITIRNFRGIRDASVDGFSRVNIVVGDNGSGKTALLEAIYLGLANSALVVHQMRAIRLGQSASVSSDAFKEILSEKSKKLSVDLRGDGEFTRSLDAQIDETRAVMFPTAQDTAGSAGQVRISFGIPGFSNLIGAPSVFRWEAVGGRYLESILQAGPAPQATGSGDLGPIVAQYINQAALATVNVAEFYSDLDKKGGADFFVEQLRTQFPDLEVIAIQIDSGQPRLFAKMTGMSEQHPIEYLSGGLTGLVTYLLSISWQRSNIVLIDEIENGLHHSRFPLLWKQIRDFAVRFDKQVFATTHSQECLDAAADAMAEAPEDFALVRTVRTEEGILIGKLPGDRASDLMLSGFEVRG